MYNSITTRSTISRSIPDYDTERYLERLLNRMSWPRTLYGGFPSQNYKEGHWYSKHHLS